MARRKRGFARRIEKQWWLLVLVAAVAFAAGLAFPIGEAREYVQDTAAGLFEEELGPNQCRDEHGRVWETSGLVMFGSQMWVTENEGRLMIRESGPPTGRPAPCQLSSE